MSKQSIKALAANAGISDSSIRRIEAADGAPAHVSVELMLRLQEYFEGRGFKFIWENEAPGVVWLAYQRRT